MTFISLIVLVLCVCASAACASPVLTNTAGERAATGTDITFQSEGSAVFTGGFSLTRPGAHPQGKVTENSDTSIKGITQAGGAVFKGTSTGEDCTSVFRPLKGIINSELCLVTKKTADQLEITGCGANVTSSLVITGATTCKYETSKVLGTLATSLGDAKVTIFGAAY